MTRATCEEKDATVVNNDLNFTYRDGCCDEAAFVKDGIHLSAHGLTINYFPTFHYLNHHNLLLQERPRTGCPAVRVCRRKKPRDAGGDGPRNGPAASTTRRTGSHNNPVESAWHTVGQCRKCGETNHVTKKCRHEVAVTCFTCGQKGHKTVTISLCDRNLAGIARPR